MKPLLLMAIGRTISAAPLGRREDDVEVRTVPVLPTARAIEADRPSSSPGRSSRARAAPSKR
jgi:hypothetical protein